MLDAVHIRSVVLGWAGTVVTISAYDAANLQDIANILLSAQESGGAAAGGLTKRRAAR